TMIVNSLFFFSSRRRHTRSTRDWSSDVCSSDLRVRINDHDAANGTLPIDKATELIARSREMILAAACAEVVPRFYFPSRKPAQEIGRASCRERGESTWAGGRVKGTE